MGALQVGLLLAGCGGGSSAPTTTAVPAPVKVSVVATTTQIGDFASVIGADLIDVKVLAEPNTSAHTLVPTADDLTALATARVVLKNGAGLETWFDDAFDNSQSSGVVYDTSKGIQLRTERVDAKPVTDPHIWMSVVNARIMVANITAALVEADPSHAVTYQAIERSYGAQLEALTRDIRQTVQRQNEKRLVTTHDNFGYYIDEFKLIDGGSILGIDPALKGAAQTQKLIDEMKLNGTRVIFADASVPLEQTSAAATAGNTRVVAGPDILYGDALGPAGSDADTYLKMMRHNASSIANNLG